MLNYNEPLGLPQGSVRAIIALVLVGAAVWCAVIGNTNNFLTEAATLVVGIYFGARASETKDTPKGEAEPQATVIDTDTEPEEREIVANKDDVQ
jgi:hypothetical protein